MEKTSKTFGQRFVAVLCALTLLFTMCPQGAFAAAPEPGSGTSAGESKTEETGPVQETTPVQGSNPVQETKPVQETTPPPEENGPDGGNSNIMLLDAGIPAENVTVKADTTILQIPVSGDGNATTLTAQPDGDVTNYTWTLTENDGVLEFVGETSGPAVNAVTVKPRKAGKATVQVACAVDGGSDITATCEITVRQEVQIEKIEFKTEAASKQSRTYDGTASTFTENDFDVTLAPADVKNAGVTVTDLEYKAAENDPNAGEHSVTVNASGAKLDGDEGLYVLASVPMAAGAAEGLKYTIQPAPVTLQSVDLGLTMNSKEYDGSADITAYCKPTYTFSGTFNSDVLAFVNVKFVTAVEGKEDANAGKDKAILAVADGDPKLNNGNYTFGTDIVAAINTAIGKSTAKPTFTITPKTVKLNSIAFTGKTYDGSGTIPAENVQYTFDPAVPDLTIENVTYTAGSTDHGDQPVTAKQTEGAEGPKEPALSSGNYALDVSGFDTILATIENFINTKSPKITISPRPVDIKISGNVSKKSDGTVTISPAPTLTYNITNLAADDEGVVQAALAAENAWVFSSAYPHENHELRVSRNGGSPDTVNPGDIVLSDVGSAEKAKNYTVNNVTFDEASFTAKIDYNLPDNNIDTLDASASDTPTLTVGGTPVTFPAGTAKGSNDKYWYTGHNMKPENADFSFVQADGYTAYDTTTNPAVDGATGEVKFENIYIADNTNKDNEAATIYGPYTVTYLYDKTAPVFEMDKVEVLSINETEYTITIKDPLSGVDSTQIEYAVDMNDKTAPTDESAWTQVTPAVKANDGYTITVVAPAKGWLFVRAKDKVGNLGTSGAICPLVIEKYAPVLELTPTSAGGSQKNYAADWTVDETKWKDTTGSVVDVQEYSGIKTVKVTLLEGVAGDTEANTEETTELKGTTSLDFTAAPPTTLAAIEDYKTKTDAVTVSNLNGTYRLRLTATDFCGNTATVDSLPFTLDNTPPEVTLAMSTTDRNAVPYYYNAENWKITVTVTDTNITEAGTYEVKVDGSNGHTFTKTATADDIDAATNTLTLTVTPDDLKDFEDGQCTVTVTAIDHGNNPATALEDASGVVYAGSGMSATFTLDKHAPLVTAVTLSPDPRSYDDEDYNYYKTDVKATFTVTDVNLSDAACGKWTAAATKITQEQQSDGTYEPKEETVPLKPSVTLSGDAAKGFTATAEVTLPSGGDNDGVYKDITLHAFDDSGNLLLLQDGGPQTDTTLGKESEVKLDTAGAAAPTPGAAVITGTRIIDTEQPTAEITFTPAGKTHATHPNWIYSNKDTTVTFVVKDNYKLTAETLTGEVKGKKGSKPVTVQADLTSTTPVLLHREEEDEYTAFIYGTDRAGNVLKVTENGSTPADHENEYDPIYTLVIDSTNPQVTAVAYSITDPDYIYEKDDGGRTNRYTKEKTATLTFTVDEKYMPVNWLTGYDSSKGPADPEMETSADGADSPMEVTITLEDEADYYDLYIKGEDLAGNPLQTTLPAAQATEAADGKVTASDGVIIDWHAPKAEITYTSRSARYVFDESDGVAAYYNAAATATIKIQEEDGHKLNYARLYAGSGTAGSAITAAALPAGAGLKTEKTYTFDKEEGRYKVTVYGTDRAGNELKVTERRPDTDSKVNTDVDAGTAYTAKVTVVRDITPPTAELTLDNRGSDVRERQTFNNKTRYYFNKGFNLTLTVKDTNLWPDYIDFNTGSVTNTDNYASTDVTATGSAGKIESSDGQTGTKTDSQTTNGIYIYSADGEDKAGNKLVLLPDSDANEYSVEKDDNPFTTYVIVVDSEPPETNVKMDDFYEATLAVNSSYTPSKNMPYQKKSSATVTFTPTDPSPTKVEYSIGSTAGGKSAETSYSYEARSVDMSGQQIFTLNELTVTDMAGNVSKMGKATNKIYLDVEAPGVDELAPTVQLVTQHNGMGRGPDGVDLYDSTVTVRALVRDPDATISASGLFEVYYKVLVNGADWTDRVDVGTAGRAQAGLITYGTSGPTLDEGSDSFDEDTVAEDDIVFTFSADTFNYNDVYVYVWAQDNSGNKLEESDAAFYRFGIDKTAPTIQVSYNNNEAENEKYFKADRTATVVITERNFDPNRTEILTEAQAAVGNWVYGAGAAANGDDDTWTCDVVYSVDGDYTFDVTTTDQVGHTAAEADYGASVAARDFTIDKTNPVITVTFNNNDERNGHYYNAARTATILVEEHNFDAAGATVETTADIQEGTVAAPGASSWSSAGDNNTATVAFLEDGDYTMDVHYTDMAGNEAEPEHIDLFTVDTTAPELEIGGVEDHVAYNGEVAPSITYHDINYDNTSAQVTITGYRHTDGENLQGARTDDAFGGSFVCDNIPALRENDDVYTATGFVSDLAGNTSEATVVFSVNRFGSTYMLGEQTRALVDGYYTNQPQDLHITEINVSPLVDQSVSVSLNGSISQLDAGTDYTVQESAPGWMQYDYTINAANFEQEGAYTVTLYSEDDAANSNTNQAIRENDGATNTLPIEFLVDMTAPVTLITGVEDSERYVDTERTLMVYYSDNTALAGLSMYIGDERVADYSAEELRDAGGQLEYVAKAANDWQTLRVTAVDVAGNSSELESGRFLLTDNLWVQYINNTPLVVGSVGGTGGLGLLIFLLLKRRKRA